MLDESVVPRTEYLPRHHSMDHCNVIRKSANRDVTVTSWRAPNRLIIRLPKDRSLSGKYSVCTWVGNRPSSRRTPYSVA